MADKIEKNKRAYTDLETESVSVAAGATNWFSKSIPAQYKNPSLEGFYVTYAGQFFNIYQVSNTGTDFSLAARNNGTTSLTTSVRFYISYDA